MSAKTGRVEMASKTIAAMDDDDGQVNEACRVVRDCQRASASLLQRRLGVDYERAHRLLDRLEALGIISAPDGIGRRQVMG